jgi:dTMP kinase
VFCSFEGVDCAGKTTQAKLLETYLDTLGYNTLLTKEPGGNLFGSKIRHLLMNEELDETEKFFLFMADRANHVRTTIKPALDMGITVITDRYNVSTWAYQYDILYDISSDGQEDIAEMATRGLQPDITFYIDIKPEICMHRMDERNDNNRLDRDDYHYYENIRDRFLYLCKPKKKWDGEKWTGTVVIDGSKSVEEVHQNIIKQYRTFV